MNRILIVGGTGRVGREVLAQLTPLGVTVRALVRDPANAQLPPHVEAVFGDLTRPETLDSCINGVDAVFLVWTAPPATLAPALKKILKNGPRIVFLSAPHKTPHPFFQQPNPIAVLHAQIEQIIEASVCQWTYLRPGMFAANALGWWAPRLRTGADLVRWPYAAAPTAPIDERNAAVAIRALCHNGHAGAENVLTGPQSLTQSEQLSIIGDAIGRPLRMEEMFPDETRREWRDFMPPSVTDMLLNAWAAAIGQPAFVTSTVEEITGAPARTFRDWARDHAAAFR